MSADRWGMLETQATVRSDAGVGGLSVEGDCEPCVQHHKNQIAKLGLEIISSRKSKATETVNGKLLILGLNWISSALG